MTWSDFYLICFALGFILSLLSFLGSAHLHLPHIDFHIGGHAHAPHAGGGAGEITPINFGTVSAFLAWFGGAGYLLTRFYSFWFLIAFGLACLSGLVGAALIFFFLAKVLIQKDEELNPADYEMPPWMQTFAVTGPHQASSEADAIKFDLAITVTLMRYIAHLHCGRINPREIGFDTQISESNQRATLHPPANPCPAVNKAG